MGSMIMPFEVRDAKDLAGVVPGAVVEFTLVVGDKAAYATKITIERYQSVEQDPLTARRLAVMRKMAGLASKPLEIGARVPDFTLIDQTRQPVSLSSLAGKVVVVNFVYTRCALPQFCLRVSNNFGVLQKRFQKELGGSRAPDDHVRPRARHARGAGQPTPRSGRPTRRRGISSPGRWPTCGGCARCSASSSSPTRG